jgi:hypothetical protein
MQNRDLAKELEHAIAATESFVSVLASEGLPSWANRFSAIAALLREGDIRAAKHSLRSCTYTGPGSLSDVFAKDETSFNRAWGQCFSSIRALAEA